MELRRKIFVKTYYKMNVSETLKYIKWEWREYGLTGLFILSICFIKVNKLNPDSQHANKIVARLKSVPVGVMQ